MALFLKSQLDYIYFFYGAAFLILIPICLFLNRKSACKLPWIWLALFGAIHGAGEWLDLLALSLETGPVFDFVRLGVLIISFICLAEFGRSGTISIYGRGLGPWILATLAGAVVMGGVAGLAGLAAATRYLLGFVGGLWAAMVLFQAARKLSPTSRSLQIGALFMVVYALAAGLVVSPAPFFPASWLNYDLFLAVTDCPIQLIRGLLSILVSFSLCFFAQTFLEKDRHFPAWFRYPVPGVMMVLVLLLIMGWAFTQHLGNLAVRDKWDDYNNYAEMMRQSLATQIGEADRLVQIMGLSPSIYLALANRTPEAIQQANSALDACSQALPDAICYLMDRQGFTIAASNRDRPNSFLGRSYALRPYFQQAMQGSAGSYWAQGDYSRQLGYYASFPVQSKAGEAIGVVAIKRALAEMQAAIHDNFLGFIIDQHGIVVMSNRPEMLLRSLWPLSAATQKELVASRQFGEGPFTPILGLKPTDKSECLHQGQRMMAVMQSLPLAGYSVVILGSRWPIAQARLLGISATLLLYIILIGFLTITIIMQESEEGFRQLFENVRDILFLHDKGKIIKVNQQACSSLGYTLKEFLGMSLFDIEVGYDKEFLLNLWDKKGGEVSLIGTYRRKDGSTFPAEIRAGDISYRGQTLRLAAVRDITERERAAEAVLLSKQIYQNLASQLLTAQEDERKRLARELHDDLTQRLAVLAMEIEMLAQQMPSPLDNVAARLLSLKNRIADLSMDTHAISRRLHPAILDDLGLVDAIDCECNSFMQREGIAVRYESKDLPPKINPDVALIIYRTVQEGLRNISRHAEATQVDIFLGLKDDAAYLSIKDNGKGFNPSQVEKKGGLGLSSMRERAYLNDGAFSLRSQPGQGTVLEVMVPLSRSAA